MASERKQASGRRQFLREYGMLAAILAGGGLAALATKKQMRRQREREERERKAVADRYRAILAEKDPVKKMRLLLGNKEVSKKAMSVLKEVNKSIYGGRMNEGHLWAIANLSQEFNIHPLRVVRTLEHNSVAEGSAYTRLEEEGRREAESHYGVDVRKEFEKLPQYVRVPVLLYSIYGRSSPYREVISGAHKIIEGTKGSKERLEREYRHAFEMPYPR